MNIMPAGGEYMYNQNQFSPDNPEYGQQNQQFDMYDNYSVRQYPAQQLWQHPAQQVGQQFEQTRPQVGHMLPAEVDIRVSTPDGQEWSGKIVLQLNGLGFNKK
jgi:hypothetical protein